MTVWLGLKCLRDGLQPFVDDEMNTVHKRLKSGSANNGKVLIHCKSCSSPTTAKCRHVMLSCDDDSCNRQHCADAILKPHIGPCIPAQCLNCKDIFCTICEKLLTKAGLCDCETKSLRPNHNKRRCINKSRSICNCKKMFTKECKLGQCGSFYDEIIRMHAHYDPMFRNCRPALWKTQPIEIAKCYLSCDGYLIKISLDDIDASGLLSICINNIHIRSKIGSLPAFEKVRV